MSAASASPGRIGLVSLGCPKALVDSEHIITRLRAEGYVLSPDYVGADLVVVNTCGFIDSAVEESLDAIGEALSENGKVIVTGCLGAKGDIVQQTHPQVLAVTGPHQPEQVLEAVHQELPPLHDPYTSLVPPQGLKLTPRHYAYLKISEGCNHRCSFCIIPSLRGDLVSRPVDEVLQEAENLVAGGTRELLVVSQDTSAYGVDTRYRTAFWNGRPVKAKIHDLARELGGLGAWVRLHYVYPYPHVDQLIPLMADGLVLPYLDVPLQHASPRVLKAMKRPANAENALARIRAWREVCPELVLRSTFITGFPGETDDDFDMLLDFLGEAQLDRVGCFTYSPVDGAAANALADPVPAELAEERKQRLMELQAGISADRLQRHVGDAMQVLVDAVDDEHAYGRGPGDAPEVDGEVIIEGGAGLAVGEFAEVSITAASEHDLWATALKHEQD